jgi:hypothetical protein
VALSTNACAIGRDRTSRREFGRRDPNNRSYSLYTLDTHSHGHDTDRGGAERVRIAGYVREPADPSADRPAFAQQEELRRYALEHGHDLVAVCRDAREPGHALGRSGYRSLLGVIATGAIDAVVLPGLEALSDDQILQEIILWDLRSRRVRVLSTRSADDSYLGSGDPGPARMLIRDVLARVAEFAAFAAGPTPRETTDDSLAGDSPERAVPESRVDGGDVVIELDAADDGRHSAIGE